MTVTLVGEAARRQAGFLVVHANRRGGTRSEGQRAVEQVQAAASAEALVAELAMKNQPLPVCRKESEVRKVDAFGMSSERRLAFEMALHGEQERRALPGELVALEHAWRAAEDIAKIADNLLVPESDEEWLRKQRGEK